MHAFGGRELRRIKAAKQGGTSMDCKRTRSIGDYLGLLFLAVFLPCHPASAASTQLASAPHLNAGPDIGNLPSFFSAISADGRFVAFSSRATNLVSNDLNGTFDIFVRDKLTAATERISVDSTEAEANGASFGRPAISADGRFVAFSSSASNLVPGDTNGKEDIFVRDRHAGTTERVSVSTIDTEADLDSQSPTISSDGRFIAFESAATNLVAGTSAGPDVFVRDRQTGVTEWISIAASTPSFRASISGDGRFVAFVSRDPGSGATDFFNVLLRDRELKKTEKVSGSAPSQIPETAISADGRFVAFNDFGAAIRVRDRKTGALNEVSVSNSGESQNGSISGLSISPSGRFIAFGSSADNLVSADTNGTADVFLRDRRARTTQRVSVRRQRGLEAHGDSGHPSVSASGRFVAFDSDAPDIVPRGIPGSQVFLRDRGWGSDGKNDLLVDFGSKGLWQYLNNRTWVKIDSASPALIATSDLDGNFRDEAIVAFPGRGLLARYNNAGAWRKLHNSVPIHLVSGDFDGNGTDDLAADFGSSLPGLWIRLNDTAWRKVRNTRAKGVGVGDLDGNGKDELIWMSSTVGFWILFNNTSWVRQAGRTPERVATGDLDGNGLDELLADFGNGGPFDIRAGLWARYNNVDPWVQLSNLTTQDLATGDRGGGDVDELVVDFGSSGLWERRDNAQVAKLDNRSPTDTLITDLDPIGKEELVAAFGLTGLWVLDTNTTTRRQIRAWPAEAIAAGGFN